MSGDGRKARDAAVAVVRSLREAGYEAYLAGGCVRDELLGLVPKDYDVATDAPPDEVVTLFDRTREVGKAFGVVHVNIGRVVTEVATFRTEGAYSDKRRPDEVRFSTAQEDAARRDFTVNALFIDPLDESERDGGRVIDFVGGVDDLGAKVIRAVGDPDERLAEDDLRSLRAVRFAARLGFEIEAGTRAAIRAHAGELIGISRERIGEELRAMLAHASRAEAVGLVQELGLDAPVLLLPSVELGGCPFLRGCAPGAGAVEGLASWLADRTLALEGGEPAGVPARLREHAEETVRALRRALVLSNEETEALGGILRGVAELSGAWRSMRAADQKRAAVSAWFDGALGLVTSLSVAEATSIRARVDELSGDGIGLAPEPVVTGDDLVAEGFEPGPSFRGWLEEAYSLQLEGVVRDRAGALARVRAWATGG